MEFGNQHTTVDFFPHQLVRLVIYVADLSPIATDFLWGNRKTNGLYWTVR